MSSAMSSAMPTSAMIERLLAEFDAHFSNSSSSSSLQSKSPAWLLELIQILLLFLQQSGNGSGSGSGGGTDVTAQSDPVMQVNLAIKKRYGLPFFKASISALFQSLFVDWCAMEKRDAEEMESDDKEVEDKKSAILASLAAIRSLGWFKMHRVEFLHVLQTAIKAHVKEICKDSFEQFFLPELQAWVREAVLPFAEAATKSQAMAPLLAHSLLKSLAQVRASELFNIVADFPDSMCAVKELKEAITNSGTLSVVGKEFRAAVCKRLLHVGASTTQIVGFYVSMIRALRVMDSSDLLLNYVAAPVRSYLVGRKDTVRCVVSALTEGKGSELHGELKRGGSLEYGADDDDEDGIGIGEHWEPRKRNLDLAEAGGRGLDVLALLVSIYGSTDLFVSDCRSMLADKLLANLDYRADAELATLELLTIRFGEEALHCCEVMLRDLEESRRINTMLQSNASLAANSAVPTDCLIVSDNYWPALQTDPVALHPTASDAIKIYETAYAAAKKPRKLEFVSQLGLVDLSLDFDDGCTRNFLATPAQASLILHLADESPQSLTSLATKCELEESDVQRRMAFWVSRDVCREYQGEAMEGLLYAIIEQQQRDRAAVETTSADLDAPQQQMTLGSEVTEKAALAQFETYVKGLLTNHGSMTLERLHTMLKLIASGGATGGSAKFDMNLVELQRFLQAFVDQDKLEFHDGQFRMRSAT